jgi:hypothetical protein
LNISILAPAASLREELDETLTVMRPDRESRRVVSSTAGQTLAERTMVLSQRETGIAVHRDSVR